MKSETPVLGYANRAGYLLCVECALVLVEKLKAADREDAAREVTRNEIVWPDTAPHNANACDSCARRLASRAKKAVSK